MPSQIENPVQYSDRGATRIRLSWKQPSANGARIQRYTIRCLPENSVFVPVLEMSIPIADLEPIASLGSAVSDKDANKKATLAKQKAAAKKKAAGANDTKKMTKKKKVAADAEEASPLQQQLPCPPSTSVFYSFAVQGLWPGEIYQFVVAAENRCGLGAFSRMSDYVRMESTAPDPPQQPVVLNIQKRQVDVRWEKPKCNGSEILHYTLEWMQDGQVEGVASGIGSSLDSDAAASSGGEAQGAVSRNCMNHSVVLLTRSIPGTSYTIQGLEPGKSLRVWLSASNLVDNKMCTSESSPASELATTLCDVPDPPVRPALLHPSAHTLVLAFIPPKCNGLDIQSYDVVLECEEVQFGITNRQLFRAFTLWVSDCEVLRGDGEGVVASAFTIKKLRAKTYYSVKLCAVNELGASAMSECSTLVTTKSPTVPARMLEPPVVQNVEPGKATISWGIPVHDGGVPVVAFHLQYSAQPSSTYSATNDGDGKGGGTCYKALFDQELTIYQGHELTATFLRPKTTYRFRVASSNAVGRSPFSKKSVAIHTPSLVEFTIATYFAERPEVEHVKARYIQVLNADEELLGVSVLCVFVGNGTECVECVCVCMRSGDTERGKARWSSAVMTVSRCTMHYGIGTSCRWSGMQNELLNI